MTATRRRRRPKTADPWSTRKRKPKLTTHTRSPRNVPAIRKATPAKKGFSDLPGEIRNQIYSMALPFTESHCIRIVRPHATGRDLDIGLFETCKAIRKEALPFLYQCSFRIDFAFDSLYQKHEPHLTRFLDGASPKCAFMWIRSLIFAYDHVDPSVLKGIVKSNKPSSVHADLLVVLSLLPKRPFYSFAVDKTLTLERDVKKIEATVERVSLLIEATFGRNGSTRKFSKANVLQVADQFYQSCDKNVIGGCGRISVV